MKLRLRFLGMITLLLLLGGCGREKMVEQEFSYEMGVATLEVEGLILEVDEGVAGVEYPIILSATSLSQDKIDYLNTALKEKLIEFYSYYIEFEEERIEVRSSYEIQRFDLDVYSISFEIMVYVPLTAYPNTYILTANFAPDKSEEIKLNDYFETADVLIDLIEKNQYEIIYGALGFFEEDEARSRLALYVENHWDEEERWEKIYFYLNDENLILVMGMLHAEGDYSLISFPLEKQT